MTHVIPTTQDVTAVTTGASAAVSPLRTPRTRRHDVLPGVRAMLPWLVGVVPFGMVVGMTARTSDGSTTVALLTGATIYSGSAQLSAIELIEGGASIAVVVASVMVINARLLMYGSSIGPFWKGAPRRFRWFAAYLLVDPSYVVGMHRYRDEHARSDDPHVHYLAAGITLWIAWHAAMILGAVLGGGLPDWLPLGYAVPLFLLAELVQSVRTRPALTAAAISGAVAVFGANLPLHGGLLVAVIVGVAIAVTCGWRTQ
jgi:predicted branched-subunit amino acid permease